MKKIFLLSVVLTMMMAMAFAPAPSLAAGPLKIGFFAPMTGFAAQTGKDMLNGLKFYLNEQNYEPKIIGFLDKKSPPERISLWYK